MRRTTVRVGLAGALAVLALALAGPASACNPPGFMLSPMSAGPGDLVQYAITNLTPGGHYELSVEGRPAASGEASGTVARGSFSMPDLGGASRGVGVHGVVQHSDIDGSPNGTGEWPVSATISYNASLPPVPQRQPQPEPPAQRGGEAPATQPAAPQGTTSPGASPNTSAGPLAGGPGGHGSGGAPTPSAPGQHGAPSPAAAEHAASGADLVSAAGTASVPAHADALTSSRARAMGKARDRATPLVPPNPSSVPKMPALARETARSGEDLPLGVLLAVSALLVAGLAGGWWARVRSRGRAPEPEPEVAALAIAETRGMDRLGVEAALQELIAEERARQMLAHPSHSERAGAECNEFAAPP